jgi:hypothetical protein
VSTPTCSALDRLCDLAFTFDAPACFGVVDDGGRLCLRDGPRIDRVDDLIGFTAPISWAGIAFVGDGLGICLDDGTEHRLRVTFVLTREGEHRSSITSDAGSDRTGGPGLADDQPRGHIADLCHRALGMAAAPESTTPDAVDLARWLDEVLIVHHLIGPAVDPEVGPLLSMHPRYGAPTTRTWVDVHRGLVELGCGWGRFTDDELAWMDAPTWARYVLDDMPDLGPLLAEAGHVLSPSAMAVVRAMVPAIGEPG